MNLKLDKIVIMLGIVNAVYNQFIYSEEDQDIEIIRRPFATIYNLVNLRASHGRAKVEILILFFSLVYAKIMFSYIFGYVDKI